jgi:hypothetical protein
MPFRFRLLSGFWLGALTALPASALPLTPSLSPRADAVIPVAQGCGPGAWRGPWGHCRDTPFTGRMPGGGWVYHLPPALWLFRQRLPARLLAWAIGTLPLHALSRALARRRMAVTLNPGPLPSPIAGNISTMKRTLIAALTGALVIAAPVAKARSWLDFGR